MGSTCRYDAGNLYPLGQALRITVSHVCIDGRSDLGRSRGADRKVFGVSFASDCGSAAVRILMTLPIFELQNFDGGTRFPNIAAGADQCGSEISGTTHGKVSARHPDLSLRRFCSHAGSPKNRGLHRFCNENRKIGVFFEKSTPKAFDPF